MVTLNKTARFTNVILPKPVRGSQPEVALKPLHFKAEEGLLTEQYPLVPEVTSL